MSTANLLKQDSSDSNKIRVVVPKITTRTELGSVCAGTSLCVTHTAPAAATLERASSCKRQTASASHISKSWWCRKCPVLFALHNQCRSPLSNTLIILSCSLRMLRVRYENKYKWHLCSLLLYIVLTTCTLKLLPHTSLCLRS